MSHRWSAIERIFHAALDRPVEARAAFLAEACGDDRELLREVQSLLDQTASTAFLEQPALQVAAGLVTATTLAPLTGHQIGVYSVGALLGRGGMGEVYRARDTRLGRDVAIKVLPRTLTSDPDRLARFEREARMLASLNHPHIGMLYGIEEGGGHRALVLELIEGETLADRLARGPVPIEQALTWARQIADALDAAHEKGIVHRDLKPANVKTTSQDTIKVLDFGLARTFSNGGDLEEPRSPTITHEGAGILGTAAYMSPEQARGQQVDRRTDVWAFGCVLYELLTGRAAFLRSTLSDTLAAVLNEQPDWTALPPALPPAVLTLLRRCLEKDVRRRRRDIADVRAELDDALAQPDAASIRTVARPPARYGRRIALALGAVVAAGVIVVSVVVWMQPQSPAPTAVWLQRITDAVGVEEMPAVSRDGRELAYVARHQGVRQIWIRRLTGGPPLQITHDNVDHDHPRWTPDSSAIVYFTPSRTEGEDGVLFDVPALGGQPPRRLAAASTGADVSPDGQWLATFQKRGTSVALVILARDGSTTLQPIPIATDALESMPVLTPPRWSPDGTKIASYVSRGGWKSTISVTDVQARTTRVLDLKDHGLQLKGVAWLPDGEGLVFASSTGSTMVYPPVFSLFSARLDGHDVRQLTFGDVSYEQPDIVATGQLFATQVVMKSDVWRFPVAGSPTENVRNATAITRQTGHVQTPSVSPDGKEIVYLSDTGGHSNIWIVKTDGSEPPRPLTSEVDARVVVGIPIWAPVGGRIVFIRDDTRAPGVSGQTEWLINRDGSHRRPLIKGASAAWSADGAWLYYQLGSCIHKVPADRDGPPDPEQVRCDAAVPAPASDGTLYFAPRGFWNANEIYKAKPENARTAELVARYPASRVPLWPTGFALSPDERWLALPLRDNGTTNIWTIPVDGGPFRQITDLGGPTLIGRQVSWSRDGKAIYAAVAAIESDIVLLNGVGAPPR